MKRRREESEEQEHVRGMTDSTSKALQAIATLRAVFGISESLTHLNPALDQMSREVRENDPGILIFTRLPTEIIVMISDWLDPWSYAMLGLACTFTRTALLSVSGLESFIRARTLPHFTKEAQNTLGSARRLGLPGVFAVRDREVPHAMCSWVGPRQKVQYVHHSTETDLLTLSHLPGTHAQGRLVVDASWDMQTDREKIFMHVIPEYDTDGSLQQAHMMGRKNTNSVMFARIGANNAHTTLRVNESAQGKMLRIMPHNPSAPFIFRNKRLFYSDKVGPPTARSYFWDARTFWIGAEKTEGGSPGVMVYRFSSANKAIQWTTEALLQPLVIFNTKHEFGVYFIFNKEVKFKSFRSDQTPAQEERAIVPPNIPNPQVKALACNDTTLFAVFREDGRALAVSSYSMWAKSLCPSATKWWQLLPRCPGAGDKVLFATNYGITLGKYAIVF